MKATVLVRLKPEVLDPQGEAVRRSLERLGLEGVNGVRVGKLIEIELDDDELDDDVGAYLERMANEMLANPVIEDFEIIIADEDDPCHMPYM